ncbi:hypothetical protein BC937DRAFT_90248 [Endogone sp. FLAS-F59071]|nr:hypothetical protein BC937DRAFT_90248 [Endogone sp. FLAS-F59071]|eukprot:RUS17221.1 hypothetical protein BC937DRAFT_90248 [Endogone sp. FLAS-F59071]
MYFLQKLSTIANTVLHRVNETPWTRAFIVTTILQAGCVIILESLVLNANQDEYDQLGLFNEVYSNTNITVMLPEFNGPVNMAQATAPALDRFNRLKYENIFFMAFQAFQLWFTFDGLYYHNTIQLIASTLINLLCAAFGVIQILESQKWLARVQEIVIAFQITDVQLYLQVKWIELALTLVMMAFALTLIFMAYKVYKQYGWVIYKRIGANITMQGHFKTYQIFIMLMKLNIFFELGFSVYFLIGIADDSYNWQAVDSSPGLLIFHAVITGLILPMLFLAYNALRNEYQYLMWLFIAFCLTAIGDFIYILGHSIAPQTDDNWFFWIFIILVSIVLAIITTIYGFLVMGNFGKGLKAYITRPSSMVLTQTSSGLQEVQGVKPTRWAIEDDLPPVGNPV